MKVTGSSSRGYTGRVDQPTRVCQPFRSGSGASWYLRIIDTKKSLAVGLPKCCVITYASDTP